MPNLPKTFADSLARRFNLSAALAGDEDHLLNGIWIVLMTLEALLVFAVAMRGIVRAVSWRVAKKRQLRFSVGSNSRPGSRAEHRPESARGPRSPLPREWGSPSSPVGAERDQRMWLRGGSSGFGFNGNGGHPPTPPGYGYGWGYDEHEDGYLLAPMDT